MRNFGVASAASDNLQNREGKLEETHWEREMVRHSWDEQDDSGKCPEQGKMKN